MLIRHNGPSCDSQPCRPFSITWLQLSYRVSRTLSSMRVNSVRVRVRSALSSFVVDKRQQTFFVCASRVLRIMVNVVHTMQICSTSWSSSLINASSSFGRLITTWKGKRCFFGVCGRLLCECFWRYKITPCISDRDERRETSSEMCRLSVFCIPCVLVYVCIVRMNLTFWCGLWFIKCNEINQIMSYVSDNP